MLIWYTCSSSWKNNLEKGIPRDTHQRHEPVGTCSGVLASTGVGKDAGKRRSAGLPDEEAAAAEDDDEDDIDA